MDFSTILSILLALGSGLSGVGAGVLYHEREGAKHTAKHCWNGAQVWKLKKAAVYRKEFPIDIPKEMPSMTAIAQDMLKLVDPAQFMFGASTSEHQCSKQCTSKICSWSRYADKHNLPQPTDSRYKMDWYNNGEAYLDDAKAQLPGLNSVRFSAELALLQPDGPHSWDESVADHYANRYIALLKRGITPLFCFHHYTDPVWFEDIGGFEKIENIDYFAHACIKLYTHIMKAVSADEKALEALKNLGPRSPLWITFNAPDGYAFRGYYANSGPPGVKSFARVAEVLKNTLEAHVRVYHGIKKAFISLGLEDMSVPKVGFLKNINQVDTPPGISYLKKWGNTAVVGLIPDQIQHQLVYDFFIKGTLWVQIPWVVDLKHTNKKAIGATDFVGLNYYSNRYQDFSKKIPITDETLTTDGDTYYHYPYGMYRAIVELHERFLKPLAQVSGKDVPMYVAENGIATNDHKKRARFYHEYMYAILRAMQDGYAVCGYTPWTFFDNYEWPSLENNTVRNYGIFSVAGDGKRLKLKEGSWPLFEFGNALQSALEQIGS